MAKKGFFSVQAASTSHLPYPALPPQYIRLILDAFRLAWSEFNTAPGPHGIDNVHQAGEVQISGALLNILCTVHGTKPTPPIPLFSETFETPGSDGSLKNFDGTKEVTRVDFCFRPKINPFPGRNTALYGLFVEAKLLSDGELHGYMRQGLIKFLRGDYAWAMCHGMMVAYVRPTTNQTLPNALVNYFGRRGNANSFALKNAPQAWSSDRRQPRPSVTVHERTWHYPGPSRLSPGDIEIIHLWLPML